jgi:ligand-binding sensor domain-containing protein
MDLDSRGKLWVLTKDGLYCQGEGDHFDEVPGRPKGKAMALAFSPISGSIFAAIDGVAWERRQDGSWISWGEDTGLAKGGIEAIVEDGTGRLWVVGSSTLTFKEPGEQHFRGMCLRGSPARLIRAASFPAIPTEASAFPPTMAS